MSYLYMFAYINLFSEWIDYHASVKSKIYVEQAEDSEEFISQLEPSQSAWGPAVQAMEVAFMAWV